MGKSRPLCLKDIFSKHSEISLSKPLSPRENLKGPRVKYSMEQN